MLKLLVNVRSEDGPALAAKLRNIARYVHGASSTCECSASGEGTDGRSWSYSIRPVKYATKARKRGRPKRTDP